MCTYKQLQQEKRPISQASPYQTMLALENDSYRGMFVLVSLHAMRLSASLWAVVMPWCRRTLAFMDTPRPRTPNESL